MNSNARRKDWPWSGKAALIFQLHRDQSHPFFEYRSIDPDDLNYHTNDGGLLWDHNPALPPVPGKVFLMRPSPAGVVAMEAAKEAELRSQLERLLHAHSRHPHFEYTEREGRNIDHYERGVPEKDAGWVPNIDYGEDGLNVFDDDSYMDIYRRRKNWQDGPDAEMPFDIAEVTRLLHLSEEHPRYEYRTVEGTWDDIKSVNPPRKDNADPNLLAPICFHEEHWERIYSLGDNPWHLNVDKINGGYEVTRKGYKLWQRRPIQETT